MATDRKLLYRQMKERIREDFVHLDPDKKLPSRPKLVARYGVTRSTIDRAISELIGEGFLYAKDGSGTYIRPQEPTAAQAQLDTWGVVVPDLADDVYTSILRAIEDVAHEVDTNVLFGSSDNREEKQSSYVRKQIRAGIKGLIIVPAIVAEEEDLAPFRELQAAGIPFVYCSREMHGIKAPRVTTNSYYGAYIAVKHLLGLGYRRIAYVSRPWYSTSLARYEGYLGALQEHGVALCKELVLFEDTFNQANPGYESTKALLALEAPPDAFFCFDDNVARGCYRAVEEHGYEIGRDIGIVGYNNSAVCEQLPVRLTSVEFPKYEIGREAAHMLLRAMKGDPGQSGQVIVLMPSLVVRESCGRTKSEGSES